MPDNFLPAATEKPILRKGYTGGDLPVSHIALLDGGIYEKQGIESLLLTNERNSRHRQNPALSPEQATLLAPSTLYLIADVSGANKDLYQAPVPRSTAGKRCNPNATGQLRRLGSAAHSRACRRLDLV
jgi:hypothetical protein